MSILLIAVFVVLVGVGWAMHKFSIPKVFRNMMFTATTLSGALFGALIQTSWLTSHDAVQQVVFLYSALVIGGFIGWFIPWKSQKIAKNWREKKTSKDKVMSLHS
jgi:predicted membrane-bound spermidine synthase